MEKTAIFTIVAKNYLPFARVLMESIREWAPGMQMFVVLVDKPESYFDPENEDFRVILSEQLNVPDSGWFHFKYTILELSTAVKPYAMEYLFARYDIERLVYLDPDIRLYSGIDRLVSALSEFNIVLTPHLTAPLDDNRRPDDLDILRSGTYNLGFIGVRRCDETIRFLHWWQSKLYNHCVVDLAHGLFVDQRWIDLVPGLFSGIGIIRDAGMNVAYWNIGHRQVQRTSDGYQVNGGPLIFFHFSGFDPEDPHRFSRHQNRFTLDDLGDGRDLVLDYGLKLRRHGYLECRSWPYAYGTFENGFPIPDMGRPAHHEAPDLLLRIADPFSSAGYEAFIDTWNGSVAGPDGKPTPITRLAYRIYKGRTDVQAAMPDIFGGDLRRFMNWMMSSGKIEHSLADVFVAPISEALKAEPRDERDLTPNPAGVDVEMVRTLAAGGVWIDKTSCRPVRPNDLNELTDGREASLHLTELARSIYQSRPDLQRFFPDPCGRDGIRFLAWFLTYGAREYALKETLLAPMRSQWNTVIEALDGPLRKVWYGFVLRSMAGSVWYRALLQKIRCSVYADRGDPASRVARAGSGASSRPVSPPLVPMRLNAASLPANQIASVNFIGYLRSEMGVGESVRCAVRAARAARIPAAVKSVDSDGPFRREDRSIGDEDREHPHPVNVFHVNADEAGRIMTLLGRSFWQGKQNIGYWAWELEKFPEIWTSSFQFYEEIWTPSTFCQKAIGKESPVPVVRMPHAIQCECRTPLGRDSFAIPSGRFVFLAIFDVLSVTERKNPLGAIKAFGLAFGASSQCQLVLKINHAFERPGQMAGIRNAAAGLPVTILDQPMRREDVNALIQTSDCLISLHRSEGFGLTLAEAMYLGKPVIATGYSGNLDFMNTANSFLVNYKTVRIPKGCEPYTEGLLWAEPDVHHAAAQMRAVAENAEVRALRAQKGSEFVRTQLAPARVGSLIRDRLELISSGFQGTDATRIRRRSTTAQAGT